MKHTQASKLKSAAQKKDKKLTQKKRESSSAIAKNEAELRKFLYPHATD